MKKTSQQQFDRLTTHNMERFRLLQSRDEQKGSNDGAIMEHFRLLQSRDEQKGSNDLAIKFQQEDVWQFLRHSNTLRLAQAREPAPFNEPSNNQYRVRIEPPLSIEPVDSEMSTTTSVQADKGSERFREQVLHPRYISIATFTTQTLINWQTT